MGKNLIQQARGKGGPRYRAPSFRYKGRAAHRGLCEPGVVVEGIILDIIHCAGHSSPLVAVRFEDGALALSLAPEGVRVGDTVKYGSDVPIEVGNTTTLADLPEGTMIYNVESVPGDGGKFARAGGVTARIISKMGKKVLIRLPSKKNRVFNESCRASIGVLAGGGRTDKPLLRAGTMYYKMKAKNKLWPKVSGSAMNAVDHPFGNKRTLRKSKARPVSRHAPPGRKVGMIAARRTGRRTGRRKP